MTDNEAGRGAEQDAPALAVDRSWSSPDAVAVSTRSPDVGDETVRWCAGEQHEFRPSRCACGLHTIHVHASPGVLASTRPASVGDAAVTDEAVRRAVCAYNEWDYAEMGRFIHMLDSRSRGMRRALESFAALPLHRPEEPR